MRVSLLSLLITMSRVAPEGNESAAGPADAINEAAARRRPPPRIQRRGSCMGSMLLSAQATEAEVDDIINGLQHSHPEALYGTRHTSQVVNNASHASELKDTLIEPMRHQNSL